ncbi:hypothetical protein niasHT_030815 [Heterodera trifolii]|uniref:Poly(A) polymerase central domain-containing protein n=1 Tax=Heterodera trifolii TaxID=157864 RepID=A0ABD2HNE5_9BILA
MTNESAFVRVRRFLLRRSDAPLADNGNFLQFGTALLIDYMIKFGNHLRNDWPKMPPGIATLATKVAVVRRDAFRHFGSARHFCVMLKLMFFGTRTKQTLVAKKEKTLLKLRTDECDERKTREKLIEGSSGTELGELIEFAIAGMVEASPGRFRSLIKCSGAKTRFARLIGTPERLKAFAKRFNLTALFAENAFTSDDCLWDHYFCALQKPDTLAGQAHKISADLAVFVRWVQRHLSAAGRDRRLLPNFFDFVDEIYEQIFDLDQMQLMVREHFLRRKLIVETKKYAEENLGENGRDKGAKVIRNGKKQFDRREIKPTEEEIGQIGPWIWQLHNTEMRRILESDQKKNAAFMVDYCNDEEEEEEEYGGGETEESSEEEEKKEEEKEEEEREKGKEKELMEKSDQNQAEDDNVDHDQQQQMDDDAFDQTQKRADQTDGQANCEQCEADQTDSDQTEEETLLSDLNEDDGNGGGENPNSLEFGYTSVECPPKEMPLKMLQEIDQKNVIDPEQHHLMGNYLQLFWHGNENFLPLSPQSSVTMKITKILATIAFYRNSAMELFALTDLYTENGTFSAKIGDYRQKWAVTQMTESEIMGENICKIYQFIYEMVNDEELKATGAVWEQYLARNVVEIGRMEAKKQIKKRIVLMPSEKHWHRVDCAERKNADAFLDALLSSAPLMEVVHTFTFVRLLAQFAQMRAIFCRGTEREILWLKHWIRMFISDTALTRLEMLSPEAMHYDHMVIANLFVLLLNQLEFKSGTFEAQNAEIRCSSPLLLAGVKKQEKKLLENGAKQFKENPKMYRILLEKIAKEKNTFYAKLKMAENGAFLLNLREAMCRMFELLMLLQKINQGKEQDAGITEEEIGKLNLDECAEEKHVENATKYNQIMYKLHLVETLTKGEKEVDEFFEKLSLILGAKTRLLKYLNTKTTMAFLPNFWDNDQQKPLIKWLWMEGTMVDELFYNDLLLSAQYSELLSILVRKNAVSSWLNLKLKLDLFVFVRWMDAKILRQKEQKNALRCANFWARNKFLLAILYDRLFDEHSDEMPTFQICQTNFLNEFYLFLDNLLSAKNAKNEKAMENGLRKIIEKTEQIYELLKVTAQLKIVKYSQLGQYKHFEGLMMEKHVETINELMANDGQFKEQLQFVYDFSQLNKLQQFTDGSVEAEISLKIINLIKIDHSALIGQLKKIGKKIEKGNEIKFKSKKSKKKKQKNIKEKNGEEEKEEEKEALDTEKDTVETVTDKWPTAEKDTVETVTNKGPTAEDQHKQSSSVAAVMRAESARDTVQASPIVAKNAADQETVQSSLAAKFVGVTVPYASSMRAKSKGDTVEKRNMVKEKEEEEQKEEAMGQTEEGEPSNTAYHSSETAFDQTDQQQNNDNELAEQWPIKLINLADDQFLAIKLTEYLATFMTEGDNDDGKSAEELIGLITVGTLANEIIHRLEAIEWLRRSSRDRRRTEKAKTIADQWEKCKALKLKSGNGTTPTDQYGRSILEMLDQLLRDILDEMGELEGNPSPKGKNGQKVAKSEAKLAKNRDELVMEELKCRKFGMEIVRGGQMGEIWGQMSKKQQKSSLKSICGQSGTETIEQFESKLEFLKREKMQRKLDEKIFYQYKNNNELSEFIEKKDRTNFDENNSQIFPSEKFQEINFVDELARKEGQTEKLKIALQLDKGRENGEKVLNELRKICNEWSADVQLQFPALFFLRHFATEFEAIGIVPGAFEWHLIFGHFECDGAKSGECADQSLNCAICQKMHPKFIEKNTDNLPSLKIVGVENVQIFVKFVEIPQFGHIPRINFSAKQLDVFLIKFGKILYQMENSDHFDEGVYWHEIRTRKELRKREYGSGGEGGDGKASKMTDEELKKFDKITEMFHQSREKALKQRELVKRRKEALFLLAEHAMHSKLLQFLLNKNNYLAILKSQQTADAFGEETLDKFCTILAYLEKWAQNNHIFGPNLGYLSTNILLIMLTKLFLLFPNSSVPFLIHKFFLIYSKWKWPMPVQLAEIDRRGRWESEPLAWSPARQWFDQRRTAWENSNSPKSGRDEAERRRAEALKSIRTELAMAAVGPAFPARNEAERTNISSAKVVQNELRKAFEKMRNKKDVNRLIEPIRSIKFSEKYENFIVIICTGTKFNAETFCQFVGTRLRYELLEFVENPLSNWVDFCHVYPKLITSAQCLAETEPKKCVSPPAAALCAQMFWLVGIQMATQQQKANSAFKKKLKDNLRKKMDEKIKRDFEKGWFHNVKLSSEVTEREKLRNWIIDPNI